MPQDQAETLRTRDRVNKIKMAELLKQLGLLEQQAGLAEEDRAERRRQMQTEVGKAREEAYQIYRDIRTASPAYRLMTGKDFQPLDVPTLRSWVGKQNALLLQYMLGEQGGFLFVVSGSREPTVVNPTVDEKRAEALGIKPGALTAKKMDEVLHAGGKDLHALLADPHGSANATRCLAELWQLPIPETLRKEIVGGKFQRLLIVPDGALAMVPFETLVVESAKSEIPARRRSGDRLRTVLHCALQSESAGCRTHIRPEAGIERGEPHVSRRRLVADRGPRELAGSIDGQRPICTDRRKTRCVPQNGERGGLGGSTISVKRAWKACRCKAARPLKQRFAPRLPVDGSCTWLATD